jgi:hypothetical protein
LAGVSRNIRPNEIEAPVRTVRRRLSTCTAILMPLVGAGDGPVDECGILNEQPDHSAKKIGDYCREALPLRLLDQAAHATVNLPLGLHRMGTFLQGG